MTNGIVEGRNVFEDRTLATDFCIIGSGAAGGVCALKLAEAGFEVLVLEEGPNIPKEQGHGGTSHVRKMFTEREGDMYRTLYQEGGSRLTKDGGIKVLQGRCLGGGTTVNWSACLPPRVETLEHWQKNYGTPFTRENLRPYLKEVANYLPIVRNDKFNTSAQKFLDGCGKLGIQTETLPNNTHDCRECGSCGVGCPYDRKLSGIVRWLPDAIGKGATIYTDTRVIKIVANGDRVQEVRAVFLDAKTRARKNTLTVRPRLGVLLAAGAIGSPSVLLRSGITLDKRVGKFTHIHPVTICIGKYKDRTFPAYGVPDNMWSPKFENGPTGYLMETGSYFPVLSASATLEHGEALHKIVREFYPFGAIMYAHHTTGFDPEQPYGTTALDRYGDPELDYKLAPDNLKAMRESLRVMSEIHLEAGAESVYHLRNPPLVVKSKADFAEIDRIRFDESQRASIFTVHVMGGCQMGNNQKRSCVDTDFRLRGMQNLWVVDASIFPTGLGANPQVTIYSLALWASRVICEKHGKPFALHHQEGGTWPWLNY
jgi:choline dehydrogenase-like flavoprotein